MNIQMSLITLEMCILLIRTITYHVYVLLGINFSVVVLVVCCYNLHCTHAAFFYTHDSFADRLPSDMESFADIYPGHGNAYAGKNSFA